MPDPDVLTGTTGGTGATEAIKNSPDLAIIGHKMKDLDVLTDTTTSGTGALEAISKSPDVAIVEHTIKDNTVNFTVRWFNSETGRQEVSHVAKSDMKLSFKEKADGYWKNVTTATSSGK
ncbi:hypothetical protein ACHAPT_012792 [Fusarium lateritium]